MPTFRVSAEVGDREGVVMLRRWVRRWRLRRLLRAIEHLEVRIRASAATGHEERPSWATRDRMRALRYREWILRHQLFGVLPPARIEAVKESEKEMTS
jgi:hypothetical protein